MADTKLGKKTKGLVLDATIRSEYRWYERRRKNEGQVDPVAVIVGATDSDSVDKAAQVVHDEIVGRFDYNQALVDAVEELGDAWGPKYVAKVIRAGLKSGAIQAEASELDGFMDEAGNWIANAIKNPGALHRQMGVPKDKKIPKGALQAAAKDKKAKKKAKRAQLALTLAKFAKRGGKKK